MIEFNRMGYNKIFDVYETYYMAAQSIRREGKEPIAKINNGIKEIYTWKIQKVYIYFGEIMIEAYKPVLQLTTIKELPK